MTFVATFLVNAGLNLAVGLLVARFLGPGEFGRYAIAMAAAVIVNTVLFEWLRLAAIRFYSERAARDEAAIRATLEFGFGALIVLLTALVGLGLWAELDTRGLAPALVVAAAAAGIGLGLYEYHAAIARARFAGGTFARLAAVKNALYLLLMVGGAWWFRDATVVVAGSALAAIAAVLLVRARLADPQVRNLAHVEPRRAGAFLAYALPLVAASAVYQAIPLLNRAWLAGNAGYAEAGYFSLAADLGSRLVQTVGSALDILLFQVAVRAEAVSGPEEAERQVSRNLAIVFALLLPSAAGYWAIVPALEALVVPAAFRGPFAAYTTILIPALLALGLVQYALNPIFQLRKRTWPAIWAAAGALATDAACLLALPASLGPHRAAAAQAAALLVGLAILAGLALAGSGRIRLSWRDLGASALGTGAMIGAVLPLRGIEPAALALAATIVVGTAVYAGIVWLTDAAGLATLARRALEGRTVPAPAR